MPNKTLRAVTTIAVTAMTVALLASGTAQADENVYGTRAGEELVERAHQVDLEFDRGHLRLRVRRTVYNGIDRHDQAEMWLDVPKEAVAVGLRTKGELKGKPHWFSGKLMEAEAAAAKYQELTGIGGYYPKDPALLSWRKQGELALQVFPVAPRSDKTVEYTLAMPAEYQDGRWQISLPAMGTASMPAKVTLRPKRRGDRLMVDGTIVKPGTTLVLDDAHELVLLPKALPLLSVKLGSVAADDDTALLRWDVVAAPRLSELPRKARIVIALDDSASLDEETRKQQLEVARSYLEQFSDPGLGAKVEIMTFDREVRRQHGRLVSVRRALEQLDNLKLSGRNGSHVDAALDEATTILSRHRDGPGRILLLTDLATRSQIDPIKAQALAKKTGALIHIGLVERGGLFLDPVGGHAWAPVAETTGGLLWQMGIGDGAKARRKTFEELARPVRLHGFSMQAKGYGPVDVPDTLDEGEGIGQLLVHTEKARSLEIRGRLWAKPYKRVVKPDKDHGKLWSALVFGSNVMDELSEPEMMTLAMHGGAVSPVTSYLAVEPGVRPSTEGLDWGTIGMGSAGVLGHGSGSGVGSGFGGRRPPDKRQWLEDQLGAIVETCAGGKRDATIGLETTTVEIVDVTSVRAKGDASGAIARCIEDATWDLGLPGFFTDDFKTWSIKL